MTQRFDDDRKSTGGELSGRQKTSIAVGVVLGVLLLIFILSNTETLNMSFLTWDVDMPMWLALLIAAVAGALLWPLLRRLVRGVRRRGDEVRT